MAFSLNQLPADRLLAEFSMWSANLVRLEDDAKRVAPFADLLHVDVADGHFAPALLFFPDLLAAVKKVSPTPVHVHLMVDDRALLSQIEQFAEAGAEIISIHAENANAAEAIARIKSLGCVPGMVLKIETPISNLKPWLKHIPFVTLLGTAIGVKGQGLNEAAPARLREAKILIAEMRGNERTVLAADGAIREHTVPLLRQSGADTVVMGSLAFGEKDLASRIAWVHSQ
jgi:ribulose-phosphate 3-epimerase